MANPRYSHASSPRKKPFPKLRWACLQNSMLTPLTISTQPPSGSPAMRLLSPPSAVRYMGRWFEQLIAADGGDANHTIATGSKPILNGMPSRRAVVTWTPPKNCFPNFPFTFGMSCRETQAYVLAGQPGNFADLRAAYENLNTNGRKAGRVCCQRNAPKCAAPNGNRTVITRHPCTTVGKLSTRCWRT